ncbi:NACHT domain-containing protein [Streptomyces sp. NPDC058741]|uniref:NACHT domain-containing protein n=1 Tax=Streptomyces sp. NPDC058741 TaxID=3346620 RepID=UPI0036CADFAB
MLEILAGKIAGAVLGASVGAAAKRMSAGPGAGLTSSPAFSRLRLKKPTSIQAKDVDSLTNHVASRLTELEKREYPHLQGHERQAALILAANTLANSSVDIWKCGLDPEFYSQAVLRESSVKRASAGLSEAAEAYCRTAIRDISVQLVQFITSWPTFAARVEVEQLMRLRSLADAVDSINHKMGPDLRVEDLDFENRYAALVIEELNQLQIFGLDLADRRNRSYDLSAAYITLSVAPMARRGVPILSTSGRSVEKFGEAPDGEITDPVDSRSHVDKGVGMRAEVAVSSYKRILLRGDAGSGKTTLLQWLAVNAAGRSFSADLADWNALVPFMLPLRRYARGILPSPSQFFPVVGSLLSEEMPDRWVHRLLRSGRALILIDGVDELPDEQRDAAHDWLRSLVSTYPEAHYIVTSRPAAAEVDWLSDEGFAVLDMLPMNQKDVEKFIEHWHNAARNSERDPSEIATLTQGEADLVKSIREERQLRRLASNPLLCALLCTLNRDRHSQLPRDRMELYRAALDLLLLRRDRERKINYPEPAHLGDSQKKSILGGFAHWLIRNGLTDSSRGQAIRQVGISLQSMPAIGADAESVFDYLLVRSGCLRKPVPERVDFIHRTFQEYLAAARIVEIDDFENLLSNAHLDQWHEVFVMAVGHARPKERSLLLSGLIERGEREPKHRKRLHLLAAACLETAIECDPPNIYSRVREITAELIPPRRIVDAKELASAGEMVIPLIPDRRLSANEAAATIRMAAIVGGDGALSLISRYARDKRVTVQRELRQSWEYFDAEEYAEKVLSKTPENWRALHIYLPHMLPALRYLSELRELHVACPVAGMDWIQGLTGVEELHFRSEVTDFSFAALAAACPQIRTLSFATSKAVDSIAELSRLQYLESLNMFRVRKDAFDLTKFPGIPHLKRLLVHGNATGVDLSNLAQKVPEMEFLYLSPGEPVESVAGISRMSHLRHANLSLPSSQAGFTHLAMAPRLETLVLRTNEPLDTKTLAQSKSLKSVRVLPRDDLSKSSLSEFDLRPFLDSGRPWLVSVSTQFDCIFLGNDTPGVVAELSGKHSPIWNFAINSPKARS